MIFTGLNQQSCYEAFIELCRHFKMEDKGEIKSFLGLNVTHDWDNHSISINQPGYIDRLLARFNMSNTISASTPLQPGCQLLVATYNDKLCNITLYQELIGSLNHLAVYSRPDIAFAMSKLSQFNSTPTNTHLHQGIVQFLFEIKLTK